MAIATTMAASPPDLSPFGRVPIELMRHIISYVVPRHLTISFAQSPSRYTWTRRSDWRVDTCEAGILKGSVVVISDQSGDGEPPRLAQRAYKSFILTSRTISTEARAVFYGENEFLFRTKMPLLRGPFGPIHPHVLCDVKVIRLVVEKDLFSTKRLTGHQHFCQRFVHTISEHRNDERQISFLKELWIEVRIAAKGSGHEHGANAVLLGQAGHVHSNEKMERAASELMCTLEALTNLPRIEHVKVTGLPMWFAECLRLYISGKGDAVQPLRWPSRRLKNKNGMPRYGSLRPNHAPSLDWAEFAQRNGIELPRCIVTSLEKHNARWLRLLS